MQKQPRPHAALIIEWANGAEIQGRAPNSTEWKDYADPAFVANWEYRVKPAREYPETKMTLDELHDAYGYGMLNLGIKSLAHVANTAIRAAIDAGQVVTREEFDKLAREYAASQPGPGGHRLMKDEIERIAADIIARVVK